MPGAHSRRAKAAAARHMATGSAPRAVVKNRRKEYRGVAQLVARHIWDVDAVGSNPATPTNPSVPMDARIFYLAKSRYEHLNHDRQICFTGESEEGYLLSPKIRDKKIFARMKKLHI